MFWFIIMIVVILLVMAGAADKSYKEKISNMEGGLEKLFNDNNFSKSAEIKLDDITYGYRIYIDENGKKLLIINTNTLQNKFINFDDIIGMDVIEDGVGTNGVGRAIIGGVLFGGAGAIVGSNTGKKVVKNVKIVIYLNSISEPEYDMIINTEKIKMDSRMYKPKIEFIRRLNATIKAILSQSEKK